MSVPECQSVYKFSENNLVTSVPEVVEILKKYDLDLFIDVDNDLVCCFTAPDEVATLIMLKEERMKITPYDPVRLVSYEKYCVDTRGSD